MSALESVLPPGFATVASVTSFFPILATTTVSSDTPRLWHARRTTWACPKIMPAGDINPIQPCAAMAGVTAERDFDNAPRRRYLDRVGPTNWIEAVRFGDDG